MPKKRVEERAREAASFLREERFPVAESSWLRGVGDESVEAVELRLHIPTRRATSAGLALYQVDKELRRAASLVPATRMSEAVLADDAVARRAFRPIRTSHGGLEVEATEKGSLEFVLHGYGAIEALLLSAPVAAAIALRELLGWAGKIRVLFRPRARDQAVVLYEEEPGVGIHVGPGVVQVDGEIPQDTRIVVTTTLASGDETRVEIERGKPY